MIRRRSLFAAAAGALAMPAVLRAQTVQKLTFYYPIAVGGPLRRSWMVIARTSSRRPASRSKPVYAGDYSQTLIKAMTAIKAGTGPQFAVLLAAEMHSLQDQDILVSLDEIGLDADGKKWLDWVLSGVHGEQPCGWEDVVGAVSALDRDILLQQGGIPGCRAGPGEVPDHLGGARARRPRS